MTQLEFNDNSSSERLSSLRRRMRGWAREGVWWTRNGKPLAKSRNGKPLAKSRGGKHVSVEVQSGNIKSTTDKKSDGDDSLF